MNFNSTSSLNFDEAVNAADKIMAKKNPKFRIISKLMISRKIRTYGYFCYYYLRWVDEYIDSNFNSLTEKKVFFENQKTLTYSITKGENVKLNFTEEYFLLYFMNYALSQPTRLLVDSFTRLLGTIGDDIRRLENRGLFSENEKQSYMNENTKSLFNITNYFLVPQSAFKYQSDFNCIRALVYTFLIGDLEEDFNLGYINISDEEIRRYQLNVVDLLNDNNLVIWYKDNFALLNKWLNEDILILKKFPFKLKLFWFWQFPYCVHKMNRIKFYNYNPTIEMKKSAVKEIKLYTLTILSTFKFIYKIFLPLEFTSFNFN